MSTATSHLEHIAKQLQHVEDRREYWNEFARDFDRWQRLRGAYQKCLQHVYRFLIPPGSRVLELGCGNGDLLAAVQPSYGVGVDFSPNMLAIARERHAHLDFVEQDVHHLDLDQKFDYVICADLVNDLFDVQQVFERAYLHSHSETRFVINAHSRLWELPRRVGESAGLAKKEPTQNWMTREDIANLLYLTNFEVIRKSEEILFPFRFPVIDRFCNRYLAKLWPFKLFDLANFLIARPQPQPTPEREPVVSVVVAARNEEGNVPQIFARVPQMGAGTELIFVEGNSKDDTYGAIEREIEHHAGMNVKLFKQPGKGKGDAVRTGFANASGEVLMILDADLTVPPEDLPRFYEAWRSGKADFVNGVRLVYPMEEKAMRFFNLVGNKFFSLAFTWLLSQPVKDTLCGTKVLSRRNYEMIAANRAYFGEIDPFGDFDLLFGAAKYNLKIVDLPVRYRERTYGETNIQRWTHGLLLLRMVALASRRIKFF
ncbi:MAG: glycosyltransferase [Acidobacteriaceae bacterium]|nr:glycosyltransferase [Acidobacteriaceae bacterium]